MQNSCNGSPPHLFVSVIIPVFKDSESLKTCLAALDTDGQTYPSNLYEVIVVDNDSAEDSIIIEDVASQFGQVSTTYESCPGSYAARNKGLSFAKGDVIAFTDADCIPASDWIAKGVVNLLHTPKCGLVAGKVKLFCKNPEQPTAVELYECIKAFPQKEYIEKYKGGATANLFTFRSVIDQVGVFDHTLKSSGDLEWGQRVFAAGYKQVYVDDMLVAHPARHSLSELYRKMVRRTGGEHDRKRKKGYPFAEFIVDLTKDLKPPLKSIFCVFLDKELGGAKLKIQVIGVMLLAKYFKAFERIRLRLGSTSLRS